MPPFHFPLPTAMDGQDDCRTITWKPLLATDAGGAGGGAGSGAGAARGGPRSGGVAGGMSSIFKSIRGAAGGRLNKNRAESVKTAHIALVLPATDPDPSHPGFFGTRALRLSEDIPNPSRTFSLLYGDWSAAGVGAGLLSGAEGQQQQAQGTLDVECPDDGMYAMLYQASVCVPYRRPTPLLRTHVVFLFERCP